ncbi:MAG: adenylate/guanylate cyclase domain-containing protein [Micavibrio sp.]|nr:adenylate/guanylate cyclase domain-containing protein [Micavibrio sp.]
MNRLLTNCLFHFLFLFVLLLAAVFYSGSDARWRKEMQNLVFDELNRQNPREKSDQLVIVNIDDDSLSSIGQWPWPRTVIADLVTNLDAYGAKSIVFDGVLAEPDRTSPRFIAELFEEQDSLTPFIKTLETMPDHDDVLAEAVGKTDKFVSAFTWGFYTEGQSKKPLIKQRILAKRPEMEVFKAGATPFKETANFLPVLEEAAAGNGSFMAIPDFDGVLRRTGVVFTDGSNLYPSLSLEAVRVAGGKPWRPVFITPADRGGEVDVIDTAYRVRFDDYAIPVESDGLLHVYYRVFDERGDDYLSAFKVIDPAFENEARQSVKDKIVLIGASAEGLKDLRSTALEPFQPGVEIHANVVEQILQGEYLLRPDLIQGAEAVFIFAGGLVMIALAPFVNVLILALVCTTLIGVAVAGSTVAYIDHGLLIDPFYPSLAVIIMYIVSVLLTYLKVEGEKRQVRDAFGHYISPEFMQELTDNPEKLKLGGEIRELTVLFSDIRSFTTISEGLTPEELILLMNNFLTPMSDLVMQNRGTIDKYMGDAMMAFWNAPLDVPDHARHACRAALGMQAALEPINASIKERAEKEGKTPVLLNAGIGLNTGHCAVGNMGSKQRFAYSTLGDAVNLASRLEGQTKNYGLEILIGETTYNQVADMAALEIDLIKVKGKENAERIFALLADEKVAESDAFIALKEKHDVMISSYRAGKFKEASKALKEARAASIFDLDKAYDVYENRISELLKNPPTEWDGVFVATSK